LIYKIISNKHLRIALVFLLIQQIIVASSTYFIARLAQSLTEDTISILYMVLFAVSLVAVYVPAYFCVTNTERAKYDAHKLYNDRFHTIFLGKTYLLSSDELQSTATTTLAQESNYTLETVIDSIFDISALVLNVLFNVLVIAWLCSRYYFCLHVCAFQTTHPKNGCQNRPAITAEFNHQTF